MKFVATLLVATAFAFNCHAQKPAKSPKKYQGLLWEISGNGLSKPSYLFGTMHVSSKLAFNLSDSFYYAIKSADVVALETNPITWQDDFSKPNVYANSDNQYGGYGRNSMFEFGNDFLKEKTFSFDKYDDAIKAALYSEPSMINGMLYRTYSGSADYEEDTYLDMYIFQTGSKLGKRMSGVEDFDESEKLVKEAYKDDAKDKRKKKNKDDEDEPEETDEADKKEEPQTVQDAYRRGDLDYIDSVDNKHNRYQSKVFLEKFLYKRNDIQAYSIDTILKKKLRLFVGVGCAHLPGDRGIIEQLRRMGYKMRPVQMGVRSSKQKEAIDNIRVPVIFNTVHAEDSLYSVAIPGKKFYSFSTPYWFATKQFADMKNGAYYLVTRLKTNALMQNDDEATVSRKIDSLLYEYIPGKIISKKAIERNGYKGIELTNRTRRGDVQRYNIFVTPFEMVVFKMSGIGEYVLKGTEANAFFSSIKLNNSDTKNWIQYNAAQAGFSVKAPHAPMMQKDYQNDRLEYWSYDPSTKTAYGILKTNINNVKFIEEDTFDLRLMDLSFASSKNIDTTLKTTFTKWQNYPALEANYRYKDGTFADVRFLLKGPTYFAQIAHYKKSNDGIKQFFESFKIQPIAYPQSKLVADSGMQYTVTSPVYPDLSGEDNELRNLMDRYGDDDEIDADEKGDMNIRTIGNDTTGEKIYVVYFKTPKSKIKDTAAFFGSNDEDDDEYDDESSSFPFSSKLKDFILSKKDSGYLSNGMKYYDIQLTDTNSIKAIWAKMMYKKGTGFVMMSIGDTVSKKSNFVAKFFESLKPVDTLKFYKADSLAANKKFFIDYASKDSATHAKALAKLSEVDFDSTDIGTIKHIIDTLSWQSKNYIELKKDFIRSLDVKISNALPIVDYLQNLYWAVKDTSDFQSTILNTLLNVETKESFTAFKNLITTEPPALVDGSSSSSYDYAAPSYSRNAYDMVRSYTKTTIASPAYSYNYGGWWQLRDTVKLANVVLPEILQLINLDDYKEQVKDYLEMMVDSNQITAKDYESLFTKFYVEAKQELKKQKAKERQSEIDKAEKANTEEKNDYSYNNYGYNNSNTDGNYNAKLIQYATLLLPFWDKNPGVPQFINDLLLLKSDGVKKAIMLLLLQNKKAVPDSLFTYFAANDKKRIDFWRMLKNAKMLDKFPAKYNTQELLVKSAVMNTYSGSDEKYDSVVYLNKLPATYKNKKGYVYFYKYKNKKEDKKWRIATVGLQPEDAAKYDDDSDDFTSTSSSYSYSDKDEIKLDDKKPINEQLEKALQKMLFKLHKSAAEFYTDNNYNYGRYYRD